MRDPELREPTCIGSMVDAELVEIGGHVQSALANYGSKFDRFA